MFCFAIINITKEVLRMLLLINKITIVLIALFIIVFVIGGYLTYRLLTRNKHLIKSLNSSSAKLEKLKENNLESKVSKLKVLSSKNEKHLEFYNKVNDAFVKLTVIDSEDISSDLVIAQQNIAEHNLKDAGAILKKINENILTLEKELNDLSEGIDAYFVKETECRNKICNSKERLRNIKQKYDDSTNELEICRAKLDKFINEIEEFYLKVEEDIDNGFYDKVNNAISENEMKIDVLEHYIETLPKIVVMGTVLLPKKFESLKERFSKLKSIGYPLHNIPFSDERERLEKAFVNIKNDLMNLNYENKDYEYDDIVRCIDSFNEKLDEEEKARQVYEEYDDQIYHTAEDLDNKYLKMKREMKSIKSIYIISDEYVDFFESIENDINKMHFSRRELDDLKYGSFKQPYSLLSDKMTILAQSSEIVEKKINEYSNYLISLRDDSQVAYELYVSYSIALNEVKSKIIRTRHNVLLEKYSDRFKNATTLLFSLNDIIHKQPIDVVRSNELLIKIKLVIDKLLSEAEDDASSCQIAENAIVFTNQYRTVFSTANASLEASEQYFENGEFEKSIETATEVLKQYSPKVYEKYIEQRQ